MLLFLTDCRLWVLTDSCVRHLRRFVADCLGESPFINDDRVTTELPTDVDEESFGPDSANRPAPNIESMHGNIDGFIQRCRSVFVTPSCAVS